MKTPDTTFLTSASNKKLIAMTSLASVVYLAILTFIFPPGNPILFGALVLGELFHTWQALTYLYTVWDMDYQAPLDKTFTPEVDVFITVAGEPSDIVEETVRAALRMDYPQFNVYILNDGFVANRPNWKEAEIIAEHYGIKCITRTVGGGAKAGNINHTLGLTTSPFVAVFDADHAPHRDFLQKTMPYFGDEKMGFVQTPQYYKNSEINAVTQGAWEQQELFYGPICRGKNRLNAVTMCGTNMVIRRKALEEVGGVCTESIAEDFATGMFIHEKGWKSTYVPEVLAEGLAPEDFLTYHKQQARWARGALDVIFKFKLLTRKGLSIAQKIQYLSSVSFFLSGVFFLINILLPLVFLYTGIIPLQVSGMLLATVFIPYIFLTLYNLSVSSGYRFTFRALAFATGGFWIQLKSLVAAARKEKTTFAISSKKALDGNFVYLVRPHIVYIVLVLIGLPIALIREGISPSVVNNLSWALVNIGTFLPFILASNPQFELKKKEVGEKVLAVQTAYL